MAGKDEREEVLSQCVSVYLFTDLEAGSGSLVRQRWEIIESRGKSMEFPGGCNVMLVKFNAPQH